MMSCVSALWTIAWFGNGVCSNVWLIFDPHVGSDGKIVGSDGKEVFGNHRIIIARKILETTPSLVFVVWAAI